MEKGDGARRERRGEVAGADGSSNGVHDPEERAAADATGRNPFSSSRRSAAIAPNHFDSGSNWAHNRIISGSCDRKEIFSFAPLYVFPLCTYITNYYILTYIYKIRIK